MFFNEEISVRADGRTCWVSWVNKALFDAEGRLVEIQGVGRDITEHKRMEEALEKERQELRLIIGSSPIIVFYKDKEGKFIRVNKAFADALRMPEEDFVGKTVFDLYSLSFA